MKKILIALCLILSPGTLYADDNFYAGKPVILTCAKHHYQGAYSVSYCITGYDYKNWAGSKMRYMRLDGEKTYKEIDFENCYVTNITCKGVNNHD